MKTISVKEVKHIAHLARLELTEDEAEVYTKELSQMIEYANTLQHLNREEISEEQPQKSSMVREDEIKQSVSTEDAFKNAPDQQENLFKVPKTFE
jgi:aspartyl-tRNA(Asn)/glutamyl-tRNA(Gln) amidotransferase subunit C